MIWWVRSEEPVILANDYIELADKLGLEKGSGKTEELIDAVKQWFENNAGWVLIFDNAQNPHDLTRYLPKIGSGHVIVTSRNPNWESLAKPLEVLVFDRPESVKFLLKRTEHRDEKAAEALADALGDLPLALEQAGAYVKETGDLAILDEPVPWDNVEGSETPLHDHLRRSIDYTLARIGQALLGQLVIVHQFDDLAQPAPRFDEAEVAKSLAQFFPPLRPGVKKRSNAAMPPPSCCR